MMNENQIDREDFSITEPDETSDDIRWVPLTRLDSEGDLSTVQMILDTEGIEYCLDQAEQCGANPFLPRVNYMGGPTLMVMSGQVEHAKTVLQEALGEDFPILDEEDDYEDSRLNGGQKIIFYAVLFFLLFLVVPGIIQVLGALIVDLIAKASS